MHDTSGWVEGIANLTEDQAATALVSSDTPVPRKPHTAVATTATAAPATTNGTPSHDGDQPTAVPSATAANLTPEDEYAARVEHALHALQLETQRVGEVVADLGAPDGFGPTDLTEQQLDALIERVRAAAAIWNADCTVVRRRRIPSARIGAGDMAAADVCVRRRAGPTQPPLEVRVAIVGNVDR